jgi:hypothetical protein
MAHVDVCEEHQDPSGWENKDQSYSGTSARIVLLGQGTMQQLRGPPDHFWALLLAFVTLFLPHHPSLRNSVGLFILSVF